MRKGPGALKRIRTCPARQARRARRKGAPRLKREFSLILALLLALNLAACGGNAGQAPGEGLSDPPSHAEAAPAASTGADLPEEDAAAPAAEPDGARPAGHGRRADLFGAALRQRGRAGAGGTPASDARNERNERKRKILLSRRRPPHRFPGPLPNPRGRSDAVRRRLPGVVL